MFRPVVCADLSVHFSSFVVIIPDPAITTDDAYLEAQKTGKTPSLCDAESVFKKLYDACSICIEAKSEDPKAVAKSYLQPKFGEFISYCSADAPNLDPFILHSDNILGDGHIHE